tara:strand:+ start:685 stop:870 length:186 start_codon:yes stop_codon:yes gene_type:complete
MEVAERSGVLDFLAKMCAGKPIAMRGPTGKRGLWHYQTIEDRKWAADIGTRPAPHGVARCA